MNADKIWTKIWTWTGWHFLPADKRLQHDDGREVVVGKWMRASEKGPHGGRPVLGEDGMHASPGPLQALECAPGPIVCLVELRGDLVVGDDHHSTAVARERRAIWMADATRVLHEFALWCAEEELQLIEGATRDDAALKEVAVSRKCLAIKRAWLAGQATEAEVFAAKDAAWAAKNATRTAASPVACAWVVAREAAQCAATESAWALDWTTNRIFQGIQLEEMLMALAPSPSPS
jgi:hypothetical protein